jgi:hypothetical protein
MGPISTWQEEKYQKTSKSKETSWGSITFGQSLLRGIKHRAGRDDVARPDLAGWL